MRTLKILLIAGLISLVVGIISIIVSYNILIKLYPSTYTLENGEVVNGMPMGQLFTSIIIGVILFASVMIVLSYILDKRMFQGEKKHL
ncbi:hypothetical protein K6119_04255 [Paracrocinitomix mangrovi]|uniref:hypothetical protein n=1 Tax=Paracrocinitomix mangrovi TaxID=2862509 RepID=UPI001C8E705E|nr:hypothetical protein [Paracrocinitomix mangrovi]UKN02726.1 hypothetical protein K6119_04255 [Paracrocinitomix mangrovi]